MLARELPLQERPERPGIRQVVEEAALPFDKRRHGMLLGMGGAAIIVEAADRHVDGDGFLYLIDRAKDLVIVSGFNVFPAETAIRGSGISRLSS